MKGECAKTAPLRKSVDTLIILELAFQVESTDTVMRESVKKHKDQLTKGIGTKGIANRMFH